MHYAPKIFHDNLTEAFTLHSCRLFWVSLWRQSCCQFLTLNTSIRIDDVRQSGIFFSPLEAGTLEQAIENQWSSVFGIEPRPNGSLTHCCCKSLPQAEIKFLKPAGLRGQKNLSNRKRFSQPQSTIPHDIPKRHHKLWIFLFTFFVRLQWMDESVIYTVKQLRTLFSLGNSPAVCRILIEPVSKLPSNPQALIEELFLRQKALVQ